MKGFVSTAVAIVATLAVPSAAKADILNGGFENGFTNWQTLGDYRIETSAAGNAQAFLSTAYDEVLGIGSNNQEMRGGNAAPFSFISGIAENSSLEGFLGGSSFLGNDDFASAVEGSAIKQTFSGRTGQTLSFQWNFLTDEAVDENADSNFNDFAFATLNFNSQNLFFRLAEPTAKFLANGSRTEFFAETGVQKFAFTLPVDGEYTLGLGVVDVGEPTVTSGLVVDKVQAVPEASSTLSLLFLGSLGMVYGLKKKRKVS